MAYILYNMVVADMYDPLVFEKFEAGYRTVSSKHMSGRVAFGALWAYYKSNQGSLYGIDFWTSVLEDHVDDLRVQEVSRLLEAFSENRQLPRSHFKELLDTQLKEKVILKFWEKEVRFNQRTLFDLMKQLDAIQWYDKEVWTLISSTGVGKKKINNIYDFEALHTALHKLNTSSVLAPHLNGAFDSDIKYLLEKHYTADRKWKYDAQARRMRPLAEVIARREEAMPDQHVMRKDDFDEATHMRAREAERKLKRLKMAKYSKELFDEIIEEMMKEKKTILEMMAELDAQESEIYKSQQRIAKKRQEKMIEE